MGCGLTVPGAGNRGRLPDGSGVRTDGWPDGRSPCPVEERRGHRSTFARKITSFPGMEELAWLEGRAQRGTAGRETHQGQREGGKGGDWREKKPKRAARNLPSR